jgi:hypothetical protein
LLGTHLGECQKWASCLLDHGCDSGWGWQAGSTYTSRSPGMHDRGG